MTAGDNSAAKEDIDLSKIGEEQEEKVIERKVPFSIPGPEESPSVPAEPVATESLAAADVPQGVEAQTPVTDSLPTESQPDAPSPEPAPLPDLPSDPPVGKLAVEPKKSSFGKTIKTILFFIALALVGFVLYKYVFPRVKTTVMQSRGSEIVYWGLWEPNGVVQEAIAEWEKTHPGIKINYQLQSPNQYRERLQSAIARGEGPDIFRYHITWVPMLKNELAPVPSTIMPKSEFDSAFYPVVSDQLSSKDGPLGIPLMFDALALYYNVDIFQAAGKTPPQNWDEVRQLATDLTTKDQDGKIVTSGIALGTTTNVDNWSDILGLMMLQNGANLTRPVGNLAEDALTYYTIFYKTDGVWDETMPASTMAFAAGKLAMYIAPSWRVFNIKEMNPSLNFGVVAIPQLPGTNVGWATFWADGVSKKSKRSKDAWEFLKFLSSKETLIKMYQSASKTRLFGEVYPRKDMASLLDKDPIAKVFASEGSSAKTWYLCSRTNDNGLNDRMIKYFEDAVNAVNQGKTPKEALETASNGVSQLLSQYGISSSAR